MNRSDHQRCLDCGEILDSAGWEMTPKRLAAVHARARSKGLIDQHGDRDMYMVALNDIGVSSSKDFSRSQYQQFMTYVNRLPDAA